MLKLTPDFTCLGFASWLHLGCWKCRAVALTRTMILAITRPPTPNCCCSLNSTILEHMTYCRDHIPHLSLVFAYKVPLLARCNGSIVRAARRERVVHHDGLDRTRSTRAEVDYCKPHRGILATHHQDFAYQESAVRTGYSGSLATDGAVIKRFTLAQLAYALVAGILWSRYCVYHDVIDCLVCI